MPELGVDRAIEYAGGVAPIDLVSCFDGRQKDLDPQN
jgi:hypothetical protein